MWGNTQSSVKWTTWRLSLWKLVWPAAPTVHGAHLPLSAPQMVTGWFHHPPVISHCALSSPITLQQQHYSPSNPHSILDFNGFVNSVMKIGTFFFPTKDLCWLNFFFFGKPNYVDKIIMQECVKSHPGPSCLTSGFILCDPEIKFSLPVSRGRKSPVLRSSTQTCYHVSSWLDLSVLFWLLILLWMRSLDLFVIKCLGFSKYFRWGGFYIYYI